MNNRTDLIMKAKGLSCKKGDIAQGVELCYRMVTHGLYSAKREKKNGKIK